MRTVTEWARLWSTGLNPYADGDAGVDYPPWALVVLSPLAALPADWLAPVWVMVNGALLALLITRLVQLVEEPARVRWALALLLAATASSRTLTQFSLLSYTLAIGGLFSSSRLIGTLCVGLSLIKPQIGGVALVWWLLRREWSRAAMALLVPVALAAVFAARADVSPITLADQYVDVMTLVHGSAEPLRGHTELRAWLVHIVPGYGTSLLASAAIVSVLLLPAVVFAARVRQWTRDDALELLALCGAASLLAVRHLSYDFLLLWPALLAWRAPPFSARSARTGWLAGFVVISALLVIELPAWIRLAVSRGAPDWLLGLTEIDRALTLAAWFVLVGRVLFVRRSNSESGVNYWLPRG